MQLALLPLMQKGRPISRSGLCRCLQVVYRHGGDRCGRYARRYLQGWGGGALASEQVAAALEGAWIIGALKETPLICSMELL